MYYDTRPVIFTKYNSSSNDYFNYGHISDNTPKPTDTTLGKTFSSTVYWNYGWVQKGYKVTAQDMVINASGNPSIAFKIGNIQVTFTTDTLTNVRRTPATLVVG